MLGSILYIQLLSITGTKKYEYQEVSYKFSCCLFLEPRNMNIKKYLINLVAVYYCGTKKYEYQELSYRFRCCVLLWNQEILILGSICRLSFGVATSYGNKKILKSGNILQITLLSKHRLEIYLDTQRSQNHEASMIFSCS